jgi:hypothetical protein
MPAEHTDDLRSSAQSRRSARNSGKPRGPKSPSVPLTAAALKRPGEYRGLAISAPGHEAVASAMTGSPHRENSAQGTTPGGGMQLRSVTPSEATPVAGGGRGDAAGKYAETAARPPGEVEPV